MGWAGCGRHEAGLRYFRLQASKHADKATAHKMGYVEWQNINTTASTFKRGIANKKQALQSDVISIISPGLNGL